MSFALAGLGTALPPNSIDQVDAAEVARLVCCRTEEQAAVLTALYRHTGIAKRHMIFGDGVIHDVKNGTADSGSVFLPSDREDDPGPTTLERMQAYRAEALPLVLRAAAQALAEVSTPPAITHLVTVSCTGFAAPGVDIGLIKGLGLAPTVQRTHVGFMGCHGAINGLRVAQAFTTADARAGVLVCCVELSSLHYHYGWHPRKVLANALFADGAAAVVGVADEHAAPDAWRLDALGSCVFPESEFAMGWNVGNHGFEMTLSPRIPGLIATHLRPWLAGWLRENDLDVADVPTWAVHPGGPRILSAVEESLGLGPDALAISREVLAECGNMSSPTVLFILERLRRRQAPRPCLALGFGPGLAAEVALFR